MPNELPKNYRFTIASDVSSRDGVGCELDDTNTGEILAEVFRDDTLKQLTFIVYKSIEIPLAVLDRMLEIFNETPGRTFIDYNLPEYREYKPE